MKHNPHTARVQDMTAGSPFSLILAFSVPLFIGNIFQQIYSMVDTGNDNRLITGSEFLTGLSYGLQDSAYNPVNGLANFAIFLAENILQLALFAVIGLGIWLFIRAMIRKGKKRRAAKREINE